MKTQTIRERFLRFFESKGHHIVPSSSLIPDNDPTLLFTNAGMVQFKNVFLGQDKRPYTRATTSQCCLRAGGKHNDLDNVGYTARHHTFFEMLGNFSFGDYFKHEAIHFAWHFLTQELQLPPEKLWITVFNKDSEAEDIWLNDIKVDPSRFSRIGEKDNFWTMGDTGPCGPCTEIFYDHGPDIAGGPPGTPEEDGDRYVEIWNLVFMQYNRDANGELHPLPKPSVDTGMGLERIAAVMQGVTSNYQTDVFQSLIQAAAKATHATDMASPSLQVIADHIRSCSFLILHGVSPSNEGRGYVLRRIIRRAARHGSKLGQENPFFHTLVSALVNVMGDAYPELAKQADYIAGVLKQEEMQFAKTRQHGMSILEKHIAQASEQIIDGEVIFKLYDTYGFPVDLTADVAREHGFECDMAGFETALEAQRNRAREASQFSAQQCQLPPVGDLKSEFTGYQTCADTGTVTLLAREGAAVSSLLAGESGIVILDKTAFYAESGGQVGDQGQITTASGEFLVQDTQKQGEVILHIGTVTAGAIKQDEAVQTLVESQTRQATARNHSATHLLHAALRQVLGDHVLQKGSHVDHERLRFDFSHPQAVTPDQLQEIERLCNYHIRANHAVETVVTSPDDAQAMGAMALFGEKYGDEVRVLRMSAFSVELCGGTHVQATGDIGLMLITQETGIAAGIRRIEAVSGEGAFMHLQAMRGQLSAAASALKTTPDQLVEKIQAQRQVQKSLEREITSLQQAQAGDTAGNLIQQAQQIGDIALIASELTGMDAKGLRGLLDELKSQVKRTVIVLGLRDGEKVKMIAGVSDDLTDVLKAGEIINFVAEQVGGRGGGRADMAQAGGTLPEKLPEALAALPDYLSGQLVAG